MSANRVTFVPDNGISLADPPTEDEPSRHRVVRNCRYTFGPVEGRDSECSYCLELMEATDITVTHSGCRNAFHDHCFDHWLATNPNLVTQNPMPSTCPFCKELLYAWPALVGPLPPAEAAAREEARRRAAAEAERREDRAALQAERAFAEADERRRLAALTPEEREREQEAVEAERRDLRAHIQAARALAETEGRTLGQPVVDREEYLRQAAGWELESMEPHVAEQEARIRAWLVAATRLVLARNPGIQRDFVLLDEIEVDPATWDQQDIARRQSIIDRLVIAIAEGDVEAHVIRGRLSRSHANIAWELSRLGSLLYWAEIARDAEEEGTEMWQEANDAFNALQERSDAIAELLVTPALHDLP